MDLRTLGPFQFTGVTLQGEERRLHHLGQPGPERHGEDFPGN